MIHFCISDNGTKVFKIEDSGYLSFLPICNYNGELLNAICSCDEGGLKNKKFVDCCYLRIGRENKFKYYHFFHYRKKFQEKKYKCIIDGCDNDSCDSHSMSHKSQLTPISSKKGTKEFVIALKERKNGISDDDYSFIFEKEEKSISSASIRQSFCRPHDKIFEEIDKFDGNLDFKKCMTLSYRALSVCLFDKKLELEYQNNDEYIDLCLSYIQKTNKETFLNLCKFFDENFKSPNVLKKEHNECFGEKTAHEMSFWLSNHRFYMQYTTQNYSVIKENFEELGRFCFNRFNFLRRNGFSHKYFKYKGKAPLGIASCLASSTARNFHVFDSIVVNILPYKDEYWYLIFSFKVDKNIVNKDAVAINFLKNGYKLKNFEDLIIKSLLSSCQNIVFSENWWNAHVQFEKEILSLSQEGIIPNTFAQLKTSPETDSLSRRVEFKFLSPLLEEGVISEPSFIQKIFRRST